MANQYITIAEANALLGISGQDALVSTLIDGASQLFDTLLGADGNLVSTYRSEYHALNRPGVYSYEQSTVFYLRNKNPTAVATINGVSVGTIDVDYIIEGQKLTLKTPATGPTDFPYRYKVVYTAGYASNAIPEDIKLAVKYMVSGLYNSRKSQGISSFRQDLLSVNYTDSGLLDTLLDEEQGNFVRSIITRYKLVHVC